MASNKENEEVFVVQWCTGNYIWFLLYGERYKACNRHPRIMGTLKTAIDGSKYVKIDDVQTVFENIGNGSILMPYFIEYCKRIGADAVKGELSSVDQGHFDRSEHFYKKHGFDVSFNQERTMGGIKLDLKSLSTP